MWHGHALQSHVPCLWLPDGVAACRPPSWVRACAPAAVRTSSGRVQQHLLVLWWCPPAQKLQCPCTRTWDGLRTNHYALAVAYAAAVTRAQRAHAPAAVRISCGRVQRRLLVLWWCLPAHQLQHACSRTWDGLCSSRRATIITYTVAVTRAQCAHALPPATARISSGHVQRRLLMLWWIRIVTFTPKSPKSCLKLQIAFCSHQHPIS